MSRAGPTRIRGRALPARLPGLLGAALIAGSATAAAHNLELTRVLVVLRSDGGYQIDLICDLDALALGANPVTDSAQLAAQLRALSPAALDREVEGLRRYLDRRVRIRFDGRAERPAVSFPQYGTPLATQAKIPTVLGLVARFDGRIPPAATELTFRASRAFPPVHLTVLDERRLSGRREVLERGVASRPYPLGEAAGDPSPGQRLGVASRYLLLGFWHILPEGLDHILFVLGLFLLSARPRPLLWQVSAFTVAHTVTLALSIYGVVRLPSSLVEPVIALSIAYVAAENLVTSELKPWRPVLVFAFGLLHGLGFAGVLDELGLPEGETLTALLAFNAGVELGQLAVLLGAFLLLGWWRDRAFYRPWLVVPLSLLIALTGLYWTIERISGIN